MRAHRSSIQEQRNPSEIHFYCWQNAYTVWSLSFLSLAASEEEEHTHTVAEQEEEEEAFSLLSLSILFLGQCTTLAGGTRECESRETTWPWHLAG
jgi:hypothetical protein